LRSKTPRLLVLIDEYDRFANKLMMANLPAYDSVVTGVSGDPLSSPIRAFYETIKEGFPGLKDYRSITFGIAPIALADASGANNINKRITFDATLADACGFTHQNLSKGLQAIGVNGEERKVALEVMQRYYNGYRFHKNVPCSVEKMLYNTTLTLSFLGEYRKDPEFREMVQNWKQEDPEQLVDKLKVSFRLLSYFPDSHSLSTHIPLTLTLKFNILSL
jgi:hypothetical protein